MAQVRDIVTARRVEAELRRDAELTRLNREIRALRVIARSCRTPAGRWAVEQRIIPLVRERDGLSGRRAA